MRPQHGCTRHCSKINRYYLRDITRGLLKPVGLVRLASDSPAFGATSHAQAKPRLLIFLRPLPKGANVLSFRDRCSNHIR